MGPLSHTHYYMWENSGSEYTFIDDRRHYIHLGVYTDVQNSHGTGREELSGLTMEVSSSHAAKFEEYLQKESIRH